MKPEMIAATPGPTDESPGDRTGDVEYVEGFAPGYLGRITQLHGEYYAAAWGTGPEFEALMARELSDFHEGYEPERDLLLTAHVNGTLVGCIAIHGSQVERPGAARIRWYLLVEGFHGRGIGSTLLRRALEFCRDRDFPLVYLWTVEGLPASLHLYEKAGFQIVHRLVDSRYTLPRTQLMLEMSLTPETEKV